MTFKLISQAFSFTYCQRRALQILRKRDTWPWLFHMRNPNPNILQARAASSRTWKKPKKKPLPTEVPDTNVKQAPAIVELLWEENKPFLKEDDNLKALDQRLQDLEKLAYSETGSTDLATLEKIVEEEEEEEMKLMDLDKPSEYIPPNRKYVEEVQLDPCSVESELPKDSAYTVDLYGLPDPHEPISNIPCPGCGASLHCQDTGIPGYLPSQKYKSISTSALKDTFCQRCHMMRNHNLALSVSVHPDEYRDVIAQVRDVRALTLLVVDMTDLPNSLFKNLPQLIGRKRPMYIVGNKIDLIPKDKAGYLKRCEDALEKVVREAGLYQDMYIHSVSLVSAKTGYGLESLITKLLSGWAKQGHVYLLGCTNAGKSTLFNALLSSDYCNAGARDFIHRATTSVWPGTTLKLLKFPIMAPTPRRIYQRIQRMKAGGSQSEEQILHQYSGQEQLTNSHTTLHGHIGQTFPGSKAQKQKASQEQYQGFDSATYSYSRGRGEVVESQHTREALWDETMTEVTEYEEERYVGTRWCYDTPGVVNPQQTINLLNQQELSASLCYRPLIPRTRKLRRGQVLFLSGLGRIDYVSGGTTVQLTVLAAGTLPLFVKEMGEADDFYRKHLGSKRLGIPLGDTTTRFPALIGQEFVVSGSGQKVSSADIVLSSLGWVAVTTTVEVTLRAYTPGGYGCVLRSPALLRYAVNNRKKRTFKTQ